MKTSLYISYPLKGTNELLSHFEGAAGGQCRKDSECPDSNSPVRLLQKSWTAKLNLKAAYRGLRVVYVSTTTRDCLVMLQAGGDDAIRVQSGGWLRVVDTVRWMTENCLALHSIESLYFSLKWLVCLSDLGMTDP